MSKADPKDYYAYLGVKPSATADQIRAAYHRCAKLCHPDVDPSPWAKARFQALNEAYRTLSNPSKRAAYDSLRWAGASNHHKTGLDVVRWRRPEFEVRSRVRVGAADCGAQALLVHRPGLPFANQIAQGLLAGDGEDDLAHGVVGPLDRGVGDLVEEIGLTCDFPELVDDLQLDPALSAGADGVDRLDQKLDQAIGQGAAAEMGVGRKPGQAGCLG